MSQTETLLESAHHRLLVADHFLTQTYPTIGDPKLLLSVLDGILKAAEEMLDAIIENEQETGHVRSAPQSIAAKLALLKSDRATHYGISHVDLAMLAEMQELLHEHRKSDVEFSRKGAYVMASKDFMLSTVSIDKLKTYLTRTKTLYTKIHDGLTRR